MDHTASKSRIIYQARLHKIIFFWPLVLIIVTGILAYERPAHTHSFLILTSVGILWFLITWVGYHFSSLTIKPGQIVFRTGMLVRQTLDIPINKIESMDIRQSILGTLMKYGSLVITGTGGTRHLIAYIHDPIACRRHVETLMHKK